MPPFVPPEQSWAWAERVKSIPAIIGIRNFAFMAAPPFELARHLRRAAACNARAWIERCSGIHHVSSRMFRIGHGEYSRVSFAQFGVLFKRVGKRVGRSRLRAVV